MKTHWPPIMLSTLTVVLPIFALIFAGWLARRIGVLGEHATTELNRFVVYLALPALLFDIIAKARWSDIWQPAFIATFGLGVAVVFAITLMIRLRRPRHLADAAIDALNASYANTGFIGFPLALIALGGDAMPSTLVATILTVCVLFAVGIALIEIGLQTEKRRRHLVVKVGGALLRNPLVVAPALGALFPLSGLPLPTAADTFLKLLGGAASPCALVALGLFLAAKEGEQRKGCGIDRAPGRAQARASAGGDMVAGDERVRSLSPAHPYGRAARRLAHRHRPVHAGRVLSPRGRHHLDCGARLDRRVTSCVVPE